MMKRLLSDRSGNFAILSAIVMPALIFVAGLGVDYGLAVDSHQRLKAAADAAALAAVAEAQEAFVQQEKVDLKELIKSSGEAFFRANVGNTLFAELDSVEVEPKINKSELSATINYTATYPTKLLSVFGHKTIPIGNRGRAIVNLRSYVNINFLIDVSASMGIGATDADQEKVASVLNCAFSCHIGQSRGSSSYDKARAAGADMRIDVVRSAAMSAIDTSTSTSQFNDQVTFGIYTFSNEINTVVPQGDQRGSNGSYLKSKLRDEVQMAITLGGTNIENALKQLSDTLPESGSGLRPDDRRQYVIVLTDGVESGQAWTAAMNWFLHQSTQVNTPQQAYAKHEVNYALNTKACQSLKNKEIDIYFIYMEYLEPKFGKISDHDKKRFGFVTDSLFPIIPKRFQDCAADPTHVMKATTPKEIEDTFITIVKGLSAPLRLY
ncbi:von Willebrand factor type A domain-containing protein [Rhizobium sp. RU33A]|uniref:TadE/TadG family type IV pilus assembly protein n=1 Tax=Rhizobium sp. RU33A TaxID=1907413 RepID=UPI000954B3EA|nr:vWA domain-containing protein [Rhizobium sp. RU33A]SIQ87578.1 von Willebrand factor type A domain-containing protein [Rhizobium sp. RU33A]